MGGKRKLALIGLAVVLGLAVLGFGINPAPVAASDNTIDEDSTTAVISESNETGTEDSQSDTLISKLADRLGLDENTVADAIKEVNQETMEEAWAERLQEAIGEGRITQEEADQVLERMRNRPDALDELGGFRLLMGHHGHAPS